MAEKKKMEMYPYSLRFVGTVAYLTKGKNVCHFLFAFLDDQVLKILQRKNLLMEGQVFSFKG